MSEHHQRHVYKTRRSRRVKRVTYIEETKEREERVQPDTIATSTQGREPVQPDTIPSSISISSVAVAPPAPISSTINAETPTASTASSTHQSSVAARAPVAFVEKDFVVNQEDPEEEEEEGGGEAGTGPKPETITSGDTSTGAYGQQQPTTNNDGDNNNKKDGVIAKSEDSLADTNNNQKRNQGSKTRIKSEELDNNYDANSTNRTRSSRRKRNQYPPEGDDFTNPNGSLRTNKKKRKNNQKGGEPAVVVNNARRINPRNKNCREEEEEEENRGKEDEEEQEEDTTIDSGNNEDHTTTNNNETTNCCKLCNDPDWERRIHYKCGTILSKYFPKSNNNPNPGWYNGTIRMHHVSSFTFGSDSEWEEEANSKEEEDKLQRIIFNEIHYEDGDTENITQDDLKVQAVGGRKVKILHSTKMVTSSNSESSNPGNVVLTTTLSGNKFDRKWLEKYHRLQQFHDENGHCRVPQRHDPDPLLGRWVSSQRRDYKNGNLAPDRVDKLNKLCFDWDPGSKTVDETWQEKYDRLVIFKVENGHCRVPAKYDPNPSLGIWVSTQRLRYKNGKMAPDRVDKLNESGFDWDARAERYDQTWQEQCDKLKKFKDDNGTCHVPTKYGPDPSLGNWIHTQRRQHKKGKLAPDRVAILDNIGFKWAIVAQTPDQMWQGRYDDIKIFRNKNGHCRVPNKFDPDPSLGNWVATQRAYYKQGKLAKDRVEKLNKIGFEWRKHKVK